MLAAGGGPVGLTQAALLALLGVASLVVEADEAYSDLRCLCDALVRVGPEQAPLFLPMLCLSLISRQEGAGQVLRMLDRPDPGYKN